MKTEMVIKKHEWQQRERSGKRASHRASNRAKKRPAAHYRGWTCAVLLAILAAGSYLGARPQETRTTAAPLIFSESAYSELSGLTYEEIRAQRERDRQEEISLLNEVIEHPQTDDATKKEALTQKAELAGRMETESAVEAALAHMGIFETQALCGAGMLTLILPQSSVGGEDDTLRVIDTAAAIAEIDPGDVKIILVKK